MPQIVADANESVSIVLQIEDEAALSRMDEIAGVGGVDALFIGRMALTVSLGAESPNDPRVISAVEHICAVAGRHDRCVGMFTTTTAEALQWRDAGVSFFLLGSDQQWVLHGAQNLVKAFQSA